uniref:Phosphatidic acid phosphatase type 2/haloperoxidase domain-containing protein n=1 Tax=Ditylenchus dipsaci TaxID=166011 RepID=A0A915DXB8_9BILA
MDEFSIPPCSNGPVSFDFPIGWFASSVKNSIGRLRPHFLDVCKWLYYILITLHLSNFVFDQMWISTIVQPSQFIDEYVCSSPESSSKIIDSRLSFFSGHSSSAFIVPHSLLCTFMPESDSLKILDHKHHASDVVVGGFVGILMACLMLYCNRHLLVARRSSFGKGLDTYHSEASEESAENMDRV